MEDPLITVRWTEHSTTLASECQDFLFSNFLVDCSLAAEGQSLQAHRLILSACSPYFHMLFSGEVGNYPIVFLKDVSFDILKALVHYVYYGETKVPGGDWDAFLALAESLKIKGVNDSSKNFQENEFLSHTVVSDVCESNDNLELSCSIPSTSASNMKSTADFPEQTPLYSSGTYPDAMHSKSSVLNEDSNIFFMDVESESAMTLPQEMPISSFWPIDTGTTMEDDPLAPETSEAKYEPRDDNANEPMQDVSEEKSCVKEEGLTLAVGEENVEQNSRSSNSSVGAEPITAMLPPSKEEQRLLPRVPREVSPRCLQGVSTAVKIEPLEENLLLATGGEEDEAQNDELMTERLEDDEHNMDRGAEAAPRLAAASALPAAEEQRPPARPGGRRAFRATGRSGGCRHVCEECGKTFPSPSQLLRHARTHTGERSYLCEVCGKAFSQASNLQRHARTHTGERPYICEDCGKGFTLAHILRTHARTHTGERLYICEECGRAFSQAIHLQTHAHTHTGERPYTCDVCGKTFSHYSTLVRHARTHTGERPYTCEVCGMAFSDISNLRRHSLHCDERPFECDDCKKTFLCKRKLTKHIREHMMKACNTNPPTTTLRMPYNK